MLLKGSCMLDGGKRVSLLNVTPTTAVAYFITYMLMEFFQPKILNSCPSCLSLIGLPLPYWTSLLKSFLGTSKGLDSRSDFEVIFHSKVFLSG